MTRSERTTRIESLVPPWNAPRDSAWSACSAVGLFRLSPALLGVAVLLTQPLAAQGGVPKALESPSAPVAALATALYNDQANFREASDSAKPALATAVLRARLQDALGDQLISFPVVDSIAASPRSLELTGGAPCNVIVRCATEIGAATGARWVVMTKVSKTSNLIWLLSAQLIRVSDGAIILDDSTELKGEPEGMIRVGIRSFADRVVRTVRSGGLATNYPAGEPH